MSAIHPGIPTTINVHGWNNRKLIELWKWCSSWRELWDKQISHQAVSRIPIQTLVLDVLLWPNRKWSLLDWESQEYLEVGNEHPEHKLWGKGVEIKSIKQHWHFFPWFTVLSSEGKPVDDKNSRESCGWPTFYLTAVCVMISLIASSRWEWLQLHKGGVREWITTKFTNPKSQVMQDTDLLKKTKFMEWR